MAARALRSGAEFRFPVETVFDLAFIGVRFLDVLSELGRLNGLEAEE
jgi:hypothetical protein